MHVLIVGAGRLGCSLVRKLQKDGYKVSVIEKDREKSEKVAASFGPKSVFCCDGTRVESIAYVQKKKKIDVFIAATNKDEDNLIACEIAKRQFKIEKVIAKSNNTENVTLMRAQGIDLILDETESLSRLVEQEIEKDKVQFISDIGDNHASLKKFRVNKNWKQSGALVKDLDIPSASILVYVKRGDDGFIPHGNSMLLSGDEVFVLVEGKNASRELKSLFC